MIWRIIYHFLHIIAYLTIKPLFRYKAIGVEYLPRKGGAILASNHASYLDPPLVGLGIWRRINYLAKKELFKNPFINYLLKNLFRAIPIDREQVDKSTLKKIYQLLNDGEVLLMFPEGTRSYNGQLQDPRIGVGMIAYNARVPVIPVYIKGSHEILPRNSKIIRIRPCKVYFGSAIALEQYYVQPRSKELYREISVKIMDAIRDLQRSAEEIEKLKMGQEKVERSLT